MPKFNLTEDAMSRLRAKFEEFQRARARIRELLADYVADYRQFQGATLARQEYLREKYARRAPKLSHLVWDDGEVLWNVPDIAILLGRDRSSVTRSLANMEREDGWRSRLLALRKASKAPNGLTVYAYHREIFELILDRYEEEYLRRFTNPRRGDADSACDEREVRRFWDYLKASAQVREEHLIRQEARELPDLPPMGWRDVAGLLLRKVFSFRTGSFFLLLFLLSFEAVRRWPGSLPWFLIASASVTAGAAVMLRYRKGAPDLLSDVGAGALLFLLLWGVRLLSPDGMPPPPAEVKAPLSPEQRRLERSKQVILSHQGPWVVGAAFSDGLTELHSTVVQGEAMKGIAYGLDTETPDRWISREEIHRNTHRYFANILRSRDISVQYVSSYIVFTDGTSSDLRITRVKHVH